MSEYAIAVYELKDASLAPQLEAKLREHRRLLEEENLCIAQGYATLKDNNNFYIEVVGWKPGAVEAAHKNSKVLKLWGEFEPLCQFKTLRDLPSSVNPFPKFKTAF